MIMRCRVIGLPDDLTEVFTWLVTVVVFAPPPSKTLVNEFTRPCFVTTVVQVEAGRISVIDVLVVCGAETVDMVPRDVFTSGTIIVDTLVNVVAGVEVVNVVTVTPGEVDEIVMRLGAAVVLWPGRDTMVRVIVARPSIVVCEFGKVVAAGAMVTTL